AMARMRTALLETVVEGIKTNIPLHQDLMVDSKSGLLYDAQLCFCGSDL
ncbi:MAG: hypothetical protein E2599_18475, partial [Klebsiella sp.]|nr:hypothetical protein [Klebsiella sp.]